MKLGIVAGELSGDTLGAGLINTLQNTDSHLSATGVGGPAMIDAGFKSLYDIESLSLMGFFEPLLHLPELIKIRRGLYHQFINNRPDVFIGIDSPDFNLGLEHKLRNANIPVVHYVSPSVWAWRKNRIKKIAKSVDLMLTLFPFEADFYRQHNVPVRFVGHPLADQIPLQPDKLAARERLNLDPGKTYVAILPGSRKNEIKYLGNLFIATAHRLWKLRNQVEFITSAANPRRDQEFQALWHSQVPEIPMKFYKARTRDVLEAADSVLVTSGTATLETMLYKRPMVIAYRTGPLTFQIARRLIKVPFIGLPNLLANERIVPEFIQNEATPESLTIELLNYLDHPEKVAEVENKFTQMHNTLRCNASQRAANAIAELLKGRPV
ncbi:MAG: lipid-A-disaccharide synthase [Gammaproteobacteria bacterium]